MTSSSGVAKYILGKLENATSMKVQKLVFYSQAWYLVASGEKLFAEEFEGFEGFDDGPVERTLWVAFRGKTDFDPSQFVGTVKPSPEECEVIDAVLATYGKMSASELRALLHRESPWKHH